MKVLVTGGCGFIGSHVVRTILEEHPDWLVVNLDALTYAGNLMTTTDIQQHPRYKFIYGSVTDAELMDRLVRGVDAVIHLAAETHVDRSIKDVTPFIHTNIIGTQTIIDACKTHGKRMHHVSTDEVFGSLGEEDAAFHECTPYDPRNPYSATKAAADHLVRAAIHCHGLKATISNCTNNYGPYLYPEKFFSIAITNILEGKPVVVHGDGLQKRDWIHVRDHARGILRVLTHGEIGHTYLMGGGTDISVHDSALLLLKLMGAKESMVTFLADRPGQDRRYAIDYGKIQRELAWTPAYTLEQGLAEMIEWYRKNQSWWRPIKQSAGYRQWYQHQVEAVQNQV